MSGTRVLISKQVEPDPAAPAGQGMQASSVSRRQREAVCTDCKQQLQ